MPYYYIHLYTDRGHVVDFRHCEIPISGPGLANTLVVITGIAVSGEANNENPHESLDANSDVVVRGDVFIHTDYWLNAQDRWQGIVDSNEELKQATAISLASLGYDDTDDPGTPTGFVLAVDEVSTIVDVNENNRVVIHLRAGLQGDSTIQRIAYQANILIQKAEPAVTFRGWERHRWVGP